MRENFVEIIGYPLEKIHTGMLAWLLDTQDGAEEAVIRPEERLQILNGLSNGKLLQERIASVDCHLEYSPFGRSLHIDLAAEVTFADKSKQWLVMEFKTDSDVRGDQLDKIHRLVSEKIRNHPTTFILLTLGASAFTYDVLDRPWKGDETQGKHLEIVKKFHQVTLPRLLEILGHVETPKVSTLFRQWIEALQTEQQRLDDAEQVIQAHEGRDRRFPRFLAAYYAYYEKLRMIFRRQQGPINNSGWKILNGINNPVMYGGSFYDNEIEGWSLWWEFDWDELRLKGSIPDPNPPSWPGRRRQIVDCCANAKREGCRPAKQRTGKDISLFVWPMSFAKRSISEVAEDAASVIEEVHPLIEQLRTARAAGQPQQ